MPVRVGWCDGDWERRTRAQQPLSHMHSGLVQLTIYPQRVVGGEPTTGGSWVNWDPEGKGV